MARRIGLLGGTFNPVHIAHLRAALEVVDFMGLDELRLVPSARPPHREAPQVSAEQRLAMVELAWWQPLLSLLLLLATVWFTDLTFVAPLWIAVFGFLGAGLLGAMGVIAGLWAEKFDQLAAFQNFLIMPMTFLSGVFYSIQSLPPFWQAVSHLNPFFYMIDGFRYGFFGQSDTSPWLSLGIVGIAWLAVSALAVHLLRTGYKIRNLHDR